MSKMSTEMNKLISLMDDNRSSIESRNRWIADNQKEIARLESENKTYVEEIEEQELKLIEQIAQLNAMI